MIRLLSMWRNEGTVVVFEGEDVDTNEGVLVAADHRPAADIIAALRDLHTDEVLVDPESWAVIARWKKPAPGEFTS